MTTQTIVQSISLQKVLSIRLPRVNWKFFMLFGFCVVLFFSVLYVFQINQMIRGGYVIKSYQKQVDDLIGKNKNLEVNLAQISYLENIQNKAKELNFGQVKTIKYIQILDSSLAKK